MARCWAKLQNWSSAGCESRQGGVGWIGDVKAETQEREIDERCSLSGFTVTQRDGGKKQREKRERERWHDRWAPLVLALAGCEWQEWEAHTSVLADRRARPTSVARAAVVS